MKRILSMLLVLAMAVSLFVPALTLTASAAEPENYTVYVSAEGSDTDGDGTEAKPFASLGKAYDALYAKNGTAGTTETNKIVVTGSVSAENFTTSTGTRAVAATISGSTEGAELRMGGVARLYAPVVWESITLNITSALTIRCRNNSLTVADSVVMASGSKDITVYGGDYNAVCTNTNISLYGGTFLEVYGAGQTKNGGQSTNITIGGNAKVYAVHGGTDNAVNSDVLAAVNITVEGGEVQNLYAGSKVANGKVTNIKNANIVIKGGKIGTLSCGSNIRQNTAVSSIENVSVRLVGTEKGSIGTIVGTSTYNGATQVTDSTNARVIFDGYCKSCGAAKTIGKIKDIAEIQATESNVEITSAENVGVLSIDADSTVTIGSETVTTTSLAQITKQPESQQIAAGSAANLTVEVRMPEGSTQAATYQWYRNSSNDLTTMEAIDGATESSYAAAPELGAMFYACQVRVPVESNIGVAHVAFFSEIAKVTVSGGADSKYVYVSENGVDENDGSFDTPVKTLEAAYALLPANGTIESNQIIIIDSVTDDTEYNSHQKHSKPATIRGLNKNATLRLGGIFRLFADTRLLNLSVSAANTFIRVRGYVFESGTGVSTAGNITIFGGDEATGVTGSPTIRVRSGKYNTINGGSNNGNGNTVANPTIEIFGGEITNVIGGNSSTSNGAVTNTTIQSATIKIHGGSIGKVFGGSDVYSSKNQNVGLVKNVKIEIDGGEIGEVYAGGCTSGSAQLRAEVENAAIQISGGKITTLSGAGRTTNSNAQNIVSASVITITGKAEIGTLVNAPLVRLDQADISLTDLQNVQSIIFYDGTSKLTKGQTVLNAASILQITRQPQAATTAYKQNTTLSVEATAADALTYQWYLVDGQSKLDGTAIAEATASSYTFAPTAFGEHRYFCVISSAAHNDFAAAVGVASDEAVITVTPAHEGDATFYVDAENGSESGDGSENSPWKTLDQAKAYLRDNKGGITGNITVLLADGVYRLDDTLTFDANDSASENQTISFRAAKNAAPEITSGQLVTGFVPYQNGIYVAQLPENAKKDGNWPAFRDLLVNGQKATRARTPNGTWNYFTGYNKAPAEGRSGFYISATDVPAIDSWSGVEITWNYEWYVRTMVLSDAVDGGDGKLELIFNPTQWQKYLDTDGKYDLNGCGYYLSNHLSFLDEQGEWFYDQTNGKIYYYPFDDEILGSTLTAEIEYPTLSTLVALTGTSTLPVQRIVFDGITFTGTTDTYATDYGYLEEQTGVESTSRHTFDAAVDMAYAKGVSVTNCTFRALGSIGLRAHEGSERVTVSDCVFRDSAMAGIWIGDIFARDEAVSRYSKNIVVRNNYITNIGMDYPGSAAIMSGRTVTGLDIISNTISYVPYDGISAGYGCSNNVSYDNEIHIEKNLIENAMYALSDGAAIYVRGGSPYKDHTIKENVIISNGSSASTRSIGIYLDCGVRNYTVTDNAVLGYKNVVMQIQTIPAQMAREHTVKDNYFTLSKQIKGKENAAKGDNVISNNLKYASIAELPQKAKDVIAAAGSGNAAEDCLLILRENKHLQIVSGNSTTIAVQVTNKDTAAKTFTVSIAGLPEYIEATSATVSVSAGETKSCELSLSLREDAPKGSAGIPVSVVAADQYGRKTERKRAFSVQVGNGGDRTIYKHTPTIDGVMDEEYKKSAIVASGTPFYPSSTAQSDVTATAYLLWDDSYLYVYVEVSDPNVISKGTQWVNDTSTPWDNDDVEVYFSDSGVEGGKKVAVDAYGIACYTVGMERPDYPYATKLTYNGQPVDMSEIPNPIPLGYKHPNVNGFVIEMAIPITQGTEDGTVPTVGEEVYFHYQNNDVQACSTTDPSQYTVVALKNTPEVYVLAGEIETATATLRFETNGGTELEDVTVDAGTTVNLSEYTTEKQGYVFEGWYLDSGLTQAVTSVTVEQDTTVYAKWEPETVTATLRFETNGGTELADITVNAGTTVNLSEYTTEKQGYTFAGWYLDSGLTQAAASVTVEQDMTVYAKWTAVRPDPTPVTPRPAPVQKPENSQQKEFSDVAKTDWYYEAVQYVTSHGIMNGTSNRTFAPNASTTRAMIATILYRLENSPQTADTKAFSDVKLTTWYGKAVNWAASVGIVGGYEDGTFKPDDPITREQLASMLYRYAKYKGYAVAGEADLNKFADAASVSPYARTAMAWAVEAGLITGRSGNQLAPQATASRAEIAVILMRFSKLVSK